jgi:hypothetical protein
LRLLLQVLLLLLLVLVVGIGLLESGEKKEEKVARWEP